MKKTLVATAFMASMISTIAGAAPLDCKVKKTAGNFLSFLQPQVGDRAVLDLETVEIESIRVGHAVFSSDRPLKKLDRQGYVLFQSKDEYLTLQVEAWALDGGPVKIQSVML